MSSHSIALAAALCLSAASMAEAGVYSLGHGDLRIRFQGGQLLQSIHLDAESIMDDQEAGNAPHGVDYVPEDTTIIVPEPTLPRPVGAEWDFIATAAGNPVWFIPEVQEFDRPWLGISTETLDRDDWTDFRIGLLGVSAPVGGHFSLTDSSGAFFAQVYFATADGINAADAYYPILQSHAHFSWLFTQPGIYEITLQVTGNHVAAGAVSSTGTYQFNVIPEPGSLVSLLALLIGVYLQRKRAVEVTRCVQ